MSTLKKALSLVQFLPLFLFLYTFGFFMTWEAAFEVSGIAAAVILIALFFARVKLDNFMLGVCFFMIVGAAMFLFNIDFLEYLYGYYMEASLFTSVLAVGVLTTFTAATGFIGVPGEAHWVRRSSIYLMLAVVVAIGLAVLMRGDMLTGFAVPWFMLLSARYMLR